MKLYFWAPLFHVLHSAYHLTASLMCDRRLLESASGCISRISSKVAALKVCDDIRFVVYAEMMK